MATLCPTCMKFSIDPNNGRCRNPKCCLYCDPNRIAACDTQKPLTHLGTFEPDGSFTPKHTPEEGRRVGCQCWRCMPERKCRNCGNEGLRGEACPDCGRIDPRGMKAAPDFAPAPDNQRAFPVEQGDKEEAAKMMSRYGMSPEEAAISVDRQKVYGDPWVNHFGIAQGIAGILQPWALRIARMEPLPPHVIANMMSALKLNRQRMRFHADNYDDLAVYQRFARAWQAEWEAAGEERPVVIPPKPHPKARLVLRWETPDEPQHQPKADAQ